MAVRERTKMSLLDVAAEVLVADPGASLAQVAEAAGMGRTTLHKHFATRDALILAVGHRALDLWDAAVAPVVDIEAADGGLRALTDAIIPMGPQLAFLWRTPAFDNVLEIGLRWQAAEERGLAILLRAQRAGAVAAGVPGWWLQQTFYSLVYSAAESIRSGHLAPRDATDLVVNTFLRGLAPLE